MVDGVGLALASIKSAADMAKTLVELRDITKVREITIDLQGQIAAAQSLAIAAQREQTAFIGEIDNLKKQIVKFENWESEKQRYHLQELPPGIFVYTLKQGMENGEPSHNICANCYNKGVKSLLHITSRNSGRTHWKCHSCGFDEVSGTFVSPPVMRQRR